MRRLLCCLALLVTTLGTLAGCGGGTTTTNIENNAYRAPEVRSTSPYNGQLGVDTETTISVTFAGKMDLQSINSATFVVTDNDGNKIAGSYHYAGTTVTFVPNAPLDEDMGYKASLSAAILSQDGVNLKPMTWTFFTGEPTPFQLSDYMILDNGTIGGYGAAYHDISATGTVSGIWGDDSWGSIPIGFTFNFFGTDYTTANVSTNGFITFGGGDWGWSNYPFPSAGLPRIAPFFDDLYIDGPGQILYQVEGAPGSRVLTVQWHNVRLYGGSHRGDFEVQLFEGTNYIAFNYLNTAAFEYGQASGGDATIGINKGDGIQDALYGYNEPVAPNGRSIIFMPSVLGTGITMPVYPADGSFFTAGFPAVVASFNKPVDPTTIAAGLTLEHNGSPVALGLQLPLFGLVLAAPQAGFVLGDSYTATLNSNLHDIYGVPLTTPYTWTFDAVLPPAP